MTTQIYQNTHPGKKKTSNKSRYTLLHISVGKNNNNTRYVEQLQNVTYVTIMRQDGVPKSSKQWPLFRIVSKAADSGHGTL